MGEGSLGALSRGVAVLVVLVLKQVSDRPQFFGGFLELRNLLPQRIQLGFFAAKNLIDIFHR